MDALQSALEMYRARQDRSQHPQGAFDKQGRWYPDANETRPCCANIRSPSRAFPYSLMVHCRSLEHIARLRSVNASELRSLERQDRQPARREGGDDYYKVVAQAENGRLLSIYDGETEYQLGVTLNGKRPLQCHHGGYYCHADPEDARDAALPDTSALLHLPRVLLRVKAEGAYTRYGQKLAFSRITPLEIVPMPEKSNLDEELIPTCYCGWTGKGTGYRGAFVHGDRCPQCGETLA
jgi:hypothetical protein